MGQRSDWSRLDVPCCSCARGRRARTDPAPRTISREGSRGVSVGLQLEGVYRRNLLGRPSAEDWLRQAADVWRELEPDLVDLSIDRIDGTPTLSMQAHPAVESLELKVQSAGHVVVSANTSTGGPGYHRRMCDDLHILGDRLGVTWQPSTDDVTDETGYFESGDRSAVDEAMLAWIGTLVTKLPLADGKQVAISMPVGHRGGPDDIIATAMGPRDRDWASRVAADPREAVDHFPWWNDERDGAHYLKRALAAMWVDVRWAVPLDEAERQQLLAVDRDLNKAYQLDPELDIPWREWSEVRRLIGGSSEGATTGLDRTINERAAPVDPAKRLIGYRRGSMPVTVGGWTIQLPRSLVVSSDRDSWLGFDADRSVRLLPLVITATDGQVPSAEELAEVGPERPMIEPGDPGLRGSATIADSVEGKQTGRVLKGIVTSPGHSLIVTIAYSRDETWARETYRSIRFTSPRT